MIPPSYLFPAAIELAGRPRGVSRGSARLSLISGGALAVVLILGLIG